MTLLAYQPETPINETWLWQTDKMLSDNATEQRVETAPYPKRAFGMQFVFDDASDIRAQEVLMLAFGDEFSIPLWQHQTKITAAANFGDAALSFIAARTDIRDGGQAYIFDRLGGEAVTINAVGSGGASLIGALSRSYTRPSVCPVASVYVGTNASLSRSAPDNGGSVGLSMQETGFLVPFANEFNGETLTELWGVPVLERQPIGTSFDQAVDTGISVTDYGGVVNIRSMWQHPQLTYPRTFRCKRFTEHADWAYWRAFADYAKGSCNPFYWPTYREDFVLSTPPAAGGTTLAFAGTSYAGTFFALEPFKAVAIFTAAGVHYATVSAAVISGGNSNVTFTPALPGGEGWGTIEKVSLLLKVRIADDKVSCDHDNLHSDISLNLRTVDA